MEIFIASLIAIALGILCGIFTGLAPGIHVNLVVTFLISLSPLLLRYTDPLILCVFIITISITHVFFEFLPSIFLGAPDPDTILSVLPGHRYLFAGNGLMAVKLSCLGAFFGILLGTLLLFPVLSLLPLIYTFIQKFMAFFLMGIIIFMTLHNTKKIWALTVFFLAGFLGIAVFSISSLKDPLFPLLTGLFGISTLLLSLFDKNVVPQQYITDGIALDWKIFFKAVIVGTFCSFFLALFPGLSPAIAALFGMQVLGNIGDHGYMLLQSSVNSAGFLMSIATLFAIEKARNGAIVGIQTLLSSVSFSAVLLFAAVSVLTAALTVPLVLFIGKKFSVFIGKIDYKKMTIVVICILFLLTFLFSGFLGILVLVTATAVGIIPGIVKVTRTQAMGCLLLPTLMYYLW